MAELLVGTRKGLFEIARQGGSYGIDEVSFLGVPVTAVLADARDGAVHAAVDHGHFGAKVHRRDPGAGFAETAAPAYPPPSEEDADIPVLRMVWTLEAGHADDPGALWAGTIPGGLFRSEDRGDSWNLVESLWNEPSRPGWFGGGYDEPGIHSVLTDPRDPDGLLVAVSCGGAWRTADRAATWACGTGMRASYMPPEQAESPVIQDLHRAARCQAVPDVIWGQHHNGMYRSDDGGATFRELACPEPSNFGFAVAAHPQDPSTAWFVPAQKDDMRVPVDGRFVVTRTVDGGDSFEVLGTGLPDRHAYHLVYRHGLDVTSDGERLAMASTTGSVWVSENGGDSWELVTTTLPPVACLRWAV